ncbi:MAG: hypothetical protein ACLQGP_14845 [Isosphaeraceae bacterium]
MLDLQEFAHVILCSMPGFDILGGISIFLWHPPDWGDRITDAIHGVGSISVDLNVVFSKA